MEELTSSLQRAAQMLDALKDKPVGSQYGSGLEMARFIRSLLPKMMDGSLSSAEKLELWHIFAPTCAWDETVGHVELGNQIFDLIEATFPDAVSRNRTS